MSDRKLTKAERMAREREVLQSALRDEQNHASTTPGTPTHGSSPLAPLHSRGDTVGVGSTDGAYSWVYERAEMMEQLKQERTARGKAEAIAAQFIQEKDAAEVLRARAEEELTFVRTDLIEARSPKHTKGGEDDVNKLQAKIKAQAAELAALQRELEQATATANDAQQQLARRDEQCSTLKQECAALQKQVTSLTSQLGSQQGGATSGASLLAPQPITNLSMDKEFRDQVAQQLVASNEMTPSPETDAYVAMLCSKAGKMNAKLMAAAQ